MEKKIIKILNLFYKVGSLIVGRLNVHMVVNKLIRVIVTRLF